MQIFKNYVPKRLVRPAGIEPASFGVLVHIFALNDFNSFKGESYIKQGLQGFKK